VAEDALAEDELAAYFCNITSPPPSLESLQIDDFGGIANWPENFFGDEMTDIAEQSKAALRKRTAQRNGSA
jgi:hypothetical protein